MTDGYKYNRERELQRRFNTFLSDEFGLPKKDYYSNLDTKGFIGLKAFLSEINNILTMKATLSFVSWVSEKLGLDASATEEITKFALQAKPNSNGYDAWLGYPVAFVAEVKCNVPINGGLVYGTAQRQGIEKDLDGLLNGKRKARMLPHECLKFLVFLDLPEVRKANDHLASVNIKFRENVLFALNDTELSRTDIVYGVYI
ncbi:hypothetical protein Thimo_2308 [Thioflavicoccus mobilis 8321]|uniref:Uncharacterized protein n=1 Tax=Thioflavicoccus mobilis 8321 TaxID=765912 RepID=L0GYM5_9GAMM|nr:hypothetical protein [Thioflavicoccus mobilis]AGA91051.1 hypothetical protein Thimo_2308 [Thioflavicoccus mobilis 8321]